MINRILAEIYISYSSGNVHAIQEFAEKTFPKDGTSQFFTGCVLILFNNVKNDFQPIYSVNRENLYDIVLIAKEKVGDINLLELYLDRINTSKGIKKAFTSLNPAQFPKYAEVILDYLEQFKPSFFRQLKDSSKVKEILSKN